MTESVFYNLASPEGVRRPRAPARARSPRRPARRLAPRRARRALRPGRRMAQPGTGIHERSGRRRGKRDGGALLLARHYRSDSNQHWRQGCPHEELAAGRFRWLQLLTHPEIWVIPGDTMGETMLALLDAERDRRLRQLQADNIDLSSEPLTVHGQRLGAPGTAALLRALRENGEREVRLVGTDMSRRRSAGTCATPSTSCRPGSTPATPSHARIVPSRAARRSAAAVVVRPPGAGGAQGFVRRRCVLVASSGGGPPRERQGRDLRDARRERSARPGWRRVQGGEAVAEAARELGYPDEDVA